MPSSTKLRVPTKQTVNVPKAHNIRRKGFPSGNRNMTIKPTRKNGVKPRK
jgi:hypothetical protein